MMSFLAFNMQVAEASVAMHEIPIATAAKEALIRQATAFPFLDDVCIGEPGHYAGSGEPPPLICRSKSPPN
jgi:hypothetical protein